jgi:hypothetical protein
VSTGSGAVGPDQDNGLSSEAHEFFTRTAGQGQRGRDTWVNPGTTWHPTTVLNDAVLLTRCGWLVSASGRVLCVKVWVRCVGDRVV